MGLQTHIGLLDCESNALIVYFNCILLDTSRDSKMVPVSQIPSATDRDVIDILPKDITLDSL